MKQNGLWVIAFVIVALMVLTSVSPLSTNRTEEIDNSTYIISNTPPDNPELGDLWFDTTLDEMNIYNGYVWQSLVPTVSGAGYQDHAAKHYWGGVDPIQFHKLSPNIRIASEFATSGSGTRSDPYIDGIQEAYDDAINAGDFPSIFLGPGRYKATHKIVFNGDKATFDLIGVGGNRCSITTDEDVTFNLFELHESVNGWMGYLTDFKIEYKGTGVVIKNYNMAELYMRGVEVSGDRAHSGLLVFNPTLQELSYNQIEDCYFLGGTDPTVPQIQFKKPSTYNTRELLMSECFLSGAYSGALGRGGIIEVDDDALQMWAITSCRWYTVGTRPLMNIKGKIGNGGFGGIHPILIDSWQATDATSRLIYFNNLVASHNANVKISGLQVKQSATFPAHYGVYIGDNWDNIQVMGNTLPDFVTAGVYIASGANENGSVTNNIGWVTEKSNSTTITNGNTHVTVTHEMDVTPTSITVTGNHSEASACWVVNITSTQFEIWVSAGVTYDRVVYWYAEAR